jgi:hypothetical protein
MAAYHVDDTANCAGAVEQRGWATYYFYTVKPLRVYRLAMVSTLGPEGACAYAVLENQDTVSIEATNYGTGGARAEASLVDAGFAIENIA